jgi:cephalosporin hydroxylase
VWAVRPDLIVETGIAHGGSLVYSASLLALLDLSEAIEQRTTLDPARSRRRVVGIDIDIRAHNRDALDAHPMRSRIELVEGSSVAPEVVARVQAIARGHERVMVLLDSMHTHDHVLAELDAYAPLVSPGSYCIVFDTFVEDMPRGFFTDRPWDPGNSPKSAVHAWLARQPDYAIDDAVARKLMVTVAPDGFLKRLR